MDERLIVKRIDPVTVEQLGAVFDERLVKRGMAPSQPRLRPLGNIIAHLVNLNAKCAVIQTNVQDPDFLAEHSAYYSKWSCYVPKLCDRIHFFSQEPISEDALEVIDALAENASSYLGFVTLRPVRTSPVAASILVPPESEYLHFIVSKDVFEVNLAGQRFEVTGTPFMQQDNAVGACAQASIWMALRTLRRKDWQSPYSPAQITSAATRFLVTNRTLPNRRGLNIEQITEAVRASGYAPHVLNIRGVNSPSEEKNLNRAKEEIYPYIESGLPVMLGLFPESGEGHAVVAIGHGWQNQPARYIELGQIKGALQKKPIQLYDASSWVEPFCIHNDNTGPYIPLSEKVVEQYHYSLADVAFAIPFMQPEVFVDASEAKVASLNILANLLEFIGEGEGGAGEELSHVDALVVRTYLQRRSDFRAWVRRSNMPDQLKQHYRQKWLPKRFWVTELNRFETYGEAPEGKGERVGEILLDPVSDPEDGAFLAVRLGEAVLPKGMPSGVLVDRNALNGEIEAVPIPAGAYASFMNAH